MKLSTREQQIVLLLQQGCTNKEIGQALTLSPHTVRDAISAMFRWAGVSNRAALVAALAKADTLVSIEPYAPHLTDRRTSGERRSAPRTRATSQVEPMSTLQM